ncbi:hypothetical protein [Xanthomonas maliensis]|uniref:hypothetical protein n=1 Tax=Xanthomonas maliensis TaxID=1321368 RepID=UPI0012647937|nr:hypothetical protein [Xanthomonas maliensis]
MPASLGDTRPRLSHQLVAYRCVEGDLVAAEDALGAPRRFVYRQHRLLQHTRKLPRSADTA